MSPTGFRWFVCAVVAVLVAIMLVVVRTNAAWPAFVPDITAGASHSASSGGAAEVVPFSTGPGEADAPAVG